MAIHSNYIVAQNPNKYGGKQEDYTRRANEAVNTCVHKINEGVCQNRDLTVLFFEILNFLAKDRQTTAKGHGTKNWEQFGRRRDIDGTEDVYWTYLDINDA